jgi:hypothetical protein
MELPAFTRRRRTKYFQTNPENLGFAKNYHTYNSADGNEETNSSEIPAIVSQR